MPAGTPSYLRGKLHVMGTSSLPRPHSAKDKDRGGRLGSVGWGCLLSSRKRNLLEQKSGRAAWDTAGGALAPITEAHTAGPLGAHQLWAFGRTRRTGNNNRMQVKQNTNTSQRGAAISTTDHLKKHAILHLCDHDSTSVTTTPATQTRRTHCPSAGVHLEHQGGSNSKFWKGQHQAALTQPTDLP